MATDDIRKALRRLFPDVRGGFELTDYLHAVGSPAQALLAASALFFPRFHFFDGSVLLADAIDTEEARTRFRTGLNGGTPRSELEESFNMVEVGYAFGPNRNETTEADDEMLAEMVCLGWQAKLARDFPDVHFDVRVIPSSETGSVAAVTFCAAGPG